MFTDRNDFSTLLLSCYEGYYDIHRFGAGEALDGALLARCDFHMEKGNYILLKRNMIWQAKCHEYCYIFSVPRLTASLYKTFESYVFENGMKLIDPKSGDHMSTFLTMMVVCDSCDRDALKMLKRCHIHRDFRFALDGWMDFHTSLVTLDTGRAYANMSGHDQVPFLKKLLKSDMKPAECSA